MGMGCEYLDKNLRIFVRAMVLSDCAARLK
jgi:hypothetical protein